jgi:hypothetical protein
VPLELTAEEAVMVLIARQEMAGRVKQALSTPFGELNIPDLTPHIQRAMTPGAGDALGQAAHTGLIGAGIGGAAGLGSSLFGQRRKHWLRNALTGALLGGAGGLAIPSISKGLQTATQTPPSVAAHVEKNQARDKALETFRRTGEFPAEIEGADTGVGALARQAVGTALSPAGDAGKAISHQLSQGNPNAATDMVGVGLRSGAEGAAGYGAGRLLDRAYRHSRFGAKGVRDIGAKDIDATLGTGTAPTGSPTLGTGIVGGATPWNTPKGSPLRPTRTQWDTLVRKVPRGRALPRAMGGAAAALPIIEAITGEPFDPAGWVQRLMQHSPPVGPMQLSP